MAQKTSMSRKHYLREHASSTWRHKLTRAILKLTLLFTIKHAKNKSNKGDAFQFDSPL